MDLKLRSIRNAAFVFLVGCIILTQGSGILAYPQCDNYASYPLSNSWGERCGPASGVSEQEMCSQIYDTELWSTCGGGYVSYFDCYIGESTGSGDYWWFVMYC
jgi:hypothetical protein